MNGLTAAKGLRRSVDDAGGVMRISVPALGDAFGRGRLTARARTGIELVLRRAGVAVEPSLNDPANDGWVTLRAVEPAEPPPQSPASRLPQFAGLLAIVVPAVVVVALVVLAIVLPDSGPAPRRVDAQPAPQAKLSAADRAETALRAGDYRLAVRLTRQSDAAAVAPLRARIATALVAQAETAQRGRAYVRAIKLARRAARYGRAPGARRIIRQSRAGLDLRRARQRSRASG